MIDLLTMWPEARREGSQLRGEIEAADQCWGDGPSRRHRDSMTTFRARSQRQ